MSAPKKQPATPPATTENARCCCSTQSHKSTRGRRKTFQSFTGQPQRHSTRQKRRQSKHSFVTAHNETTASVSSHNIPLFLEKIITPSCCFSLLSSHRTVLNKTHIFLDRLKSNYFGSQVSSQSLNEVISTDQVTVGQRCHPVVSV